MSFGTKSIGEEKWKPHGCNIATNPKAVTSETRNDGPDWTSSLRCVKPSDEIRPIYETGDNSQGRRSFPHRNECSAEEWTFYWDGTKYGKRCNVDGIYNGNMQTQKEILVGDAIGSKLKVNDPRGGIGCQAPGDKSYYVPEYSKGFHKEGSTLPAINFSRTNELMTDTFIPLQPLPKQRSVSYNEKEVERKENEEKLEVKQLDDWKPAPAIAPGLL